MSIYLNEEMYTRWVNPKIIIFFYKLLSILIIIGTGHNIYMTFLPLISHNFFS